MVNDRFNAVEGQTVRLYFRNYVSNILTDIVNWQTKLTVKIVPRGTSTIISPATPTIKRESTGIYYFDWSIPSSTPTSMRYSSTFPGPGDYQDIWRDTNYPVGSDVLISQDFFVREEGFPGNLANVVEPIQLTHELVTQRFESGAKDFLVWKITENNGRLVDGESLYPEGEIQIFLGDQLIKNYQPFSHKEDSELYRLYLDTTALESGVYKVQSRFFIPAGIFETPASVTTSKSLANGFSPSEDSILGLTVDGVTKQISFPTSATQAQVQATVPATVNFQAGANDIFKIIIDGTEYEIRLVNTNENRTIEDIVDELNGTPPEPYRSSNPGGGPITFPIVTSYKTFDSVPLEMNGTTLTFEVDGETYSVQFSVSVSTTVNQVVSQINTAYTPGTICTSTGFLATNTTHGGILIFNDSGSEEIVIVGGTALSYLGFVAGQSDTNEHDLSSYAGITEDGEVITISSSSELRILSASEGSTANSILGFSALGTESTFTEATGAEILGTGIVFPIEVINTSPALIRSVIEFESQMEYPDTPIGVPSSPDDPEFSVTINGVAFNVDLEDDFSPPAIVGTVTTGSFVIGASSDTLTIEIPSVGADVISFANATLSLNDVVNTINTQLSNLSGYVLADTFEGRVRIRSLAVLDTVASANNVLRVALDDANSAATVLGFADVTTAPEQPYQNDQVRNIGTDQVADDYVNPFTRSMLLTQVNAVISTQGEMYFDADELIVESNTTGTSSTITVGTGDAESLLGLANLSSTGVNPVNTDFDVDINAVVQTISLSSAPAKGLTTIINEINSQAEGFIATNENGQLKLTTVSTGAGVTMEISNVGSQTTVESLFGAADPISDTGADAIDAELTSSEIVTTIYLESITGTFTNGQTVTEGANLGVVVSWDSVGSVLRVTTTDTAWTPSNTVTGPSGNGDITAVKYPGFKAAGNGILVVTVDDEPSVDIDLSQIPSPTISNIVSYINGFFASSIASSSGQTLYLTSPTIGSDGQILIGGLNDGSNANTSVGFSADGVESFGTDGTPYTLSQIVNIINASFGGALVASESANFLTLSSIEEGAESTITIEETTSANILSDFGLALGDYIGETTSRVSQTIVSTKRTLIIGD